MNKSASPALSIRIAASHALIVIALALFISMFVLFTYTFLHESGHALVGLVVGQKLTAFRINFLTWDTYVEMAGRLTQPQQAMKSIAGALLPLLLWSVLINFVARRASFTLEVLKLLGSMVVLNTLLAWIVLPVLYVLGRAPADDVSHFLVYSEMPPLLLTFLAGVFYAGGWVLFLSKIDGLRNEFQLFRTTNRQTLTAGARTVIPVMAGILAVCIVLTLTLQASAAGNVSELFAPPPGFQPIAQIDLARRPYAQGILAQFTLEKTTFVGVFVDIRHIDTRYFDLSLKGLEGYSSTVLHGEGYRTEQDGGLWEQFLPPGAYRIVLTSHQGPGTVSVYLKTH